MSVDYKTARHICNVIHRQILSGFPELHLHFILHKEDEREQAFQKDIETINKHPAGHYILKYPDLKGKAQILKKNKSRFTLMGIHKNPGFIGLFRSEAYIGIFLINHDRFRSSDDLRNHALHIAWHAIELYMDYIRKPEENEIKSFTESHNVLVPQLTEDQRCYRNLLADIFSGCVQKLQGRKDAFDLVTTQRIYDTLTPQTDFQAEHYPSPICADTFDFAFEDSCLQNLHNKNIIVKAANITQNISAAFNLNSIEQWQSFAQPSQYMAWTGHRPEIILGAALYTGENIHAQSISDMISERMEIKPELITFLEKHNPFAHPDTNLKIHEKQCLHKQEKIFSQIHHYQNIHLLMEEAEKENHALEDNNITGWCANALIAAYKHLKTATNPANFPAERDKAIKIFKDSIQKDTWDALIELSYALFPTKRRGESINENMLLDITKDKENYKPIQDALIYTKNYDPTNPPLLDKGETKEDSQTTQINIADLINIPPDQK